MNKRVIAIGFLILIFSIWWQPFNFAKKELTIPKGMSAHQISSYLASYKVVRDIHEFLFWLKILRKDKALKSGTYELYSYKNPIYVINQLTSGGKCDITVTIPEGLTIEQVAEILSEKKIITEKFTRLCYDQKFIQRAGLNTSSLEGYLFPDTYSFSPDLPDSLIIITFIKNFYRHINKLGIQDRDSLHKILILASLVEKEAKYEDERPIIARVFLNRLKLNRSLESCATVIYALRNQFPKDNRAKVVLTEKNLMVASPYNTYLHTGLPPGPICSPGEASIKAVLSPSAVDYLYFVLKQDGRHYFSKTYQEHLAAKKLNAKK